MEVKKNLRDKDLSNCLPEVYHTENAPYDSANAIDG